MDDKAMAMIMRKALLIANGMPCYASMDEKAAMVAFKFRLDQKTSKILIKSLKS